MKNLYPFLKYLALGSVAAALFSGCGGGSDDGETAEVIDNTAEVEEYYATFKRVPLELQAKLNAGEVGQEEFNRAMEDVPLFFQFKTIADIPEGLDWTNGMELPEFGSPNAKKGGTSYGALQDYPRTLRRVGPDSNGSFRPYILDDVAMRMAKRHPNVTGIGPEGHYYYPELATEWAVDKENKTVYVRLDPSARWSDGEPVTVDDYMFMFFFYQSKYIQAHWYNNWYTEM